jgi:pimeloyl-ACP methyl ester carboxylesterase
MNADTTQVVLLHPIGNNKDCWQFLGLDGFVEGSIGRYEMPGHGITPRHPSMTFASMADEVVEQFDGLLDLVGVAVGASVALCTLGRPCLRRSRWARERDNPANPD